MKITKKQMEEINFLTEDFDFPPTQEEMEEYVKMTVRGEDGDENNRILKSKWRMDLTISEWKKGILDGDTFYCELIDDCRGNKYCEKLVKSTMDSILEKKPGATERTDLEKVLLNKVSYKIDVGKEVSPIEMAFAEQGADNLRGLVQN